MPTPAPRERFLAGCSSHACVRLAEHPTAFRASAGASEQRKQRPPGGVKREIPTVLRPGVVRRDEARVCGHYPTANHDRSTPASPPQRYD